MKEERGDTSPAPWPLSTQAQFWRKEREAAYNQVTKLYSKYHQTEFTIVPFLSLCLWLMDCGRSGVCKAHLQREMLHNEHSGYLYQQIYKCVSTVLWKHCWSHIQRGRLLKGQHLPHPNGSYFLVYDTQTVLPELYKWTIKLFNRKKTNF